MLQDDQSEKNDQSPIRYIVGFGSLIWTILLCIFTVIWVGVVILGGGLGLRWDNRWIHRPYAIALGLSTVPAIVYSTVGVIRSDKALKLLLGVEVLMNSLILLVLLWGYLWLST